MLYVQYFYLCWDKRPPAVLYIVKNNYIVPPSGYFGYFNDLLLIVRYNSSVNIFAKSYHTIIIQCHFKTKGANKSICWQLGTHNWSSAHASLGAKLAIQLRLWAEKTLKEYFNLASQDKKKEPATHCFKDPVHQSDVCSLITYYIHSWI